MKTPVFVGVVAVALLGLAALPAYAAAPSAVKNVSAITEADGKVKITWEKLPDSDAIAYYRIYFSKRSILAHAGSYDDFEAASGERGDHILSFIPKVGPLYIAVLAVNTSGEETSIIESEVLVEGLALPEETDVEDSSSGVEPEPAAETEGSLVPSVRSEPSSDMRTSGFHVVSTQVVSPTRIVLSFNEPVTVNPAEALVGFAITTPQGDALRIQRLTIEGPGITIDTAMQEKGRDYRIVLGSSVHPMERPTEAIGEDDPAASFIGHPAGSAGDTGKNGEASIADGVGSIELSAADGPEKTFVITAQWSAPKTFTPIEYRVMQSTDLGRHYSAPQTVTGNTTAVRFENVKTRSFGVAVQAVDEKGRLSELVFRAIDLTGAMLPPKVIRIPAHGGQAAALIPPKKPSGLPQTGAGVGVALLLTWGVMVWRRRSSAGSKNSL